MGFGVIVDRMSIRCTDLWGDVRRFAAEASSSSPIHFAEP
jgi:hypothetical protein